MSHELSSLVALPEYDLWGTPSVQLTVEKDEPQEYRPISSLTNNTSPIQFEIRTGLNQYIQFRECTLYMCLRVNLAKHKNLIENKEDKVTKEDWDKICPVNYLLHSMIKQITVTIGQTQISTSSNFYPYIALIDAMTVYSKETKETLLTSSGWYKDDYTKMDSFNEKRSKLIRPSSADVTKGCELELYGRLHLDLCSQDRAIIGGSTITVTIFPNDPKFYLIYDDSLVPTVEIVDCILKVHKAKVSNSIVVAHNRALKISSAKYFINRRDIKSFILQKGTLDAYINNIINGQIPRRVIIGFVSNDAFNGDNKLNPFYFKNYNIKQIVCYIDGTPYPSRPYQPNFSSNKYTREFFGLYEALNQTGYASNLDISINEFKDGFTLFAINFSPDLSDSFLHAGYASPTKFGNLRMEIRFSKDLVETINAIIYCEFDNLIEVNEERVAIKNYN